MFALTQKGLVRQIEAVKFPVHEDLVWVDITGISPVPEPGWSYDGTDFTAPPQETRPARSAPALNAEEIATLMVSKGLATRDDFDTIKTSR